ncbi:hypothetical protein F5Y12DRAFT_245330 [Xylaria sp. FL1777]|nr:hypothetical protein F5Y12DRAFT_245330 [Xylaria sp. FL1777]
MDIKSSRRRSKVVQGISIAGAYPYFTCPIQRIMLYSPGLDTTVPSVPKTKRAAKQPKRCSECGVCFSKTEHLARHIRSHTKEKPFSCRECGKSYSRQSRFSSSSFSSSCSPPGQ